jgi:hypothetical protein
MSEESLRSHEQDTEIARAKLAGSLAALRSPATFSAFKNDLKKEALDTKDVLVDQAKSAAQSKVNELIEDLKAKAAANPAAVIAIGAGLAWRAIRKPPIAPALIGLGVFSLWRTNAPRLAARYQPDYLEEGKKRLKEQAGEAVSKVKEMAGRGQTMMSAQAAELTEAARDKTRRWRNEIRDAVEDAKSSLEADAPSIAPSDDRIQAIEQDIASSTGARFNGAAPQGALMAQESRDKLLLGVAGLAVATAVGIACQKRLAERDDPNTIRAETNLKIRPLQPNRTKID